MFWVMRLAAFVLSVSVGISVWFLTAMKKPNGAQTVQKVMELPTAKTGVLKAPKPQREDPSGPSIKLKPVEPLAGYANVKTMTLRDTPDANAPVVSKFKVGDYEAAEILGASGGFLHVRFPARDAADGGAAIGEHAEEGWAMWGSVVPELSAIVLDAETGAVVGRVPLSGDVTSIAYSPDGSRATFYSGQGGPTACEVKTSDYTVTKCFSLTGQNSYNTIFYGPTDGALYAAIFTRGKDYATQLTGLKIVRVSDEGVSNISEEIPGEAEDFAVSPDGLTGFILHRQDKARQEMIVDVVDLGNFKIRNSFTLHGTDLPETSGTFVLNRDGTELYARLYSEGSTVSVIDTGTGNTRRVLGFNASPKDYWYFDSSDLVGDSLLIRIWNQDQDEMHTPPHVFWLGNGGRVAAEKGIYWGIQAGDVRYAVNEHGTRLFKLDSNNKIRESLSIERPEFRKGLTSESGLSTFGLSASPDGKRIILFVGVEDGC